MASKIGEYKESVKEPNNVIYKDAEEIGEAGRKFLKEVLEFEEVQVVKDPSKDQMLEHFDSLHTRAT